MEIKFNVNRDKIINAILYICSKLNGSVNIYNCLKIFYEADKYHLNKYGVVITGDKYIAMEHGTVPSATKDILYEKSDYWHNDNNKLYTISTTNKPDLDVLSKSNLEALDKGIEKYGNLEFAEVEYINQQEEGFKKTEKNKQIKFEDMIDDDNPEKEDIIKELQEMSGMYCL